MKILVLNAGSSSQKCALFEAPPDPPLQPAAPLWEADIDWRPGGAERGSERALLQVKTVTGQQREEEIPASPRLPGLVRMLHSLWSGDSAVLSSPKEIAVVGHRVVHGGARYHEPKPITPEVKEAIAALAELAPAHNPASLEGIQLVEQELGAVPQVAVFDTAFHSTLPPAAAVYPGPYSWFEAGIRRYGFHGISHEYCLYRAAEILGHPPEDLKLVSCHLGNGCSLAAIRGGKSVDTTMGYTPLEGLMMATRSGSVDPGILIHLARKSALSGDDLDRILNQESGLLGVSGVSGDMREIQKARAAGSERAALAFEVYLHRLWREIGGMIASAGGLDTLVFTGGVGEHQPELRQRTVEAFAFLGVRLDGGKNQANPVDSIISTAASEVSVLVLRAQEDWAIARACARLRSSQ